MYSPDIYEGLGNAADLDDVVFEEYIPAITSPLDQEQFEYYWSEELLTLYYKIKDTCLGTGWALFENLDFCEFCKFAYAQSSKSKPVMRPKEVVITSGGSRGIVSLGAAWKLQQEGIFDETHTYAGTSAGAVVAAGLAMGIECPKMLQRALAKPFQPDIRPGRFGLDSGKGLSAFIRRILGLRRPMTLKQLYQHTGKTLRICVCNVTDRCAEYWSHETHPNVDLLKALRISCSVPIMFAAVKMRGKLYVDGAVINCLPVRGNPADTLAITFAHEPKDVDNLEDFIGALCSMRLGDPPPRYDVRVDARGIDALDFRLDRRKSREAFQKGQQQASEWIKKNV